MQFEDTLKQYNELSVTKADLVSNSDISSEETQRLSELDTALNLMSVIQRMEVDIESNQISTLQPSKKNPFVLQDTQGTFFL